MHKHTPHANLQKSTPRSETTNPQPLLSLGAIVATRGALDLLDRYGINATHYLTRHQCGDFGTICPEDVQENMTAIKYRLRVLSAYDVGTERLWVITEADRSSTTLLLPSEY